ncbi:unnamed protein product [Clavelina lepadiformis]|uniref:HTH CENPB-type domain-containing protein n=1 Tax=Clavelina lepadiformis TaxID=159417 RepID=A0ABP0FDN6_CLALP
MSEETKTKTFRASVGQFSELGDILYLWIYSMRRASLPVPPSLVIAKAKQIAQQLLISEDDFQVSWQWLSRLRARRGLQKVFHVDDENKEEYSQEILGDVNEVLETMQTENDDTDDKAGPSNDFAPVENSIVFHGFEQLYNKVLEVEDQLLCPALQDQAGGAYDNLKSTFECFQRKLRQLMWLLFKINKLLKKLNPEFVKNFCVLIWDANLTGR